MPEFMPLLTAAATGDRSAGEIVFRVVYDDLKQLAAQLLARERPGHTLQPTALVHEVYFRLTGDSDRTALPFENRGHFFAAAANAMRQILIESARRKATAKRGGGRRREDLDPDAIAEPEAAEDLLALDEALTKFAMVEPKIAELVNLRYFGGLTIKESAAVLGISPRTADSHWAYARAWLLAAIQQADQK